MVDKKKLNRVKRVLSAGNGAELPKYIVKPGDTLSQIVLAYNKINNTNFSLQDIATCNNITDPNNIQAGQTLSFTNPQHATAIPGADSNQGDPNAAVYAAAQTNAAADAQADAATAAATAQRRVEQLPAISTEFLNGPTPDEKFKQQVQKHMNERVSAGMNYGQEMSKKANAINGAGQIVTGALESVGGTLGAAQSATDSNTTKTADALYDTAAGVVENLGPYGKIVGTAMKFAGMAGDAIQAMGGGTDQ